jgi:hypothetical protein
MSAPQPDFPSEISADFAEHPVLQRIAYLLYQLFTTEFHDLPERPSGPSTCSGRRSG